MIDESTDDTYIEAVFNLPDNTGASSCYSEYIYLFSKARIDREVAIACLEACGPLAAAQGFNHIKFAEFACGVYKAIADFYPSELLGDIFPNLLRLIMMRTMPKGLIED